MTQPSFNPESLRPNRSPVEDRVTGGTRRDSLRLNILLINHYAGSDRYGMEYRPFNLAREWVRMGHTVTIVGSGYSHLRHTQPEARWLGREEIRDGVRFLWFRGPRYHGNGVRRVQNIFTFVGQLLLRHRRLARNVGPDVVISSSTYPFDSWPAYLIARRSKAVLVHELHDLWPLTLIEVGGMSSRNPFVALMHRAERFAYRRSDVVVSILPAADKYMVRHGMAIEKFVHIPNGVMVEDWESHVGELPTEHRELLARLRSEGRFIVGYTGTHGIANALHTLLEAASYLRHENVHFVLVGHGPEKEDLQALAGRLGLTNVSFLPPVTKAAIPSLLRQFDAGFIGQNDRPLYQYGVSPNKLFDYMMAGIAVLQGVEPGGDLVLQTGCGFSVPAGDSAALAAAIEKLIGMDPEERARMGLLGREFVVEHHDFPLLAKRFVEAVDRGHRDLEISN